MSSANLSQQETAHRAATVEVHAYHVEVDVRDAVDPAHHDFPVVARLTLTAAEGETWLDFLGEVDSLLIDGEPQPVQYDGARLRLTDLPVGRRCEVLVGARARYSRTGEGLHRFVDPVDGETYLYTQYEPADARRVFPTMEQPDVRAPFTFSVTGPAGWWFGSNQPEANRTPVSDGVVRVDFEPTATLSTYITCLCAGPYHRVTAAWTDAPLGARQPTGPSETRELELGLLCRRSLVQHLDADELFRVTRAGLDWFTENFSPYPWGAKYDQIFVPEYNLGAMENPGLVTFTEQYLFRSTPTPAQLQGRANTVLHEMSHMWFGDLVTPRWWGDLWLKESFAEFMGTHVSVEAAGFDEGWVNFATQRKVGAYLADSMPTTHPVVADIPDLEAAKTNFDRITYSKGASALTQLVHFVGLPAFLAGSRRYFTAHAFSSATLADFIDALAAETDRNLSTWSAAWLQTAGHDTLSATVLAEPGDGTVRELVVHRDFFGAGDADAGRPHATTVGLYRLVGDRLELDSRHDVVLAAGETPVVAAAGRPLPDAVLLNDLDHTFAKVALDETSRGFLLGHVGDLDPLPRAVAWTALWHDVRAGYLQPGAFVASVVGSGERQTGVLASLIERAFIAVSRYSTDHLLAVQWRDGARAATGAAEAGSPEQLLWARAYLRAAALAAQDVRWVLDGGVDGLELSPDLTWLAWQSLSTQGAATDAELDAALAADDTAAGRTARLRAWASRPEAAVKEEAWRRAHTVDGETNDAVDALLAGFTAPGQRELREPYAGRYFASLEQVWRDHPIEIAMRLVRGGFPEGGHAAGRDWLAAHPAAPATLVRLVREEIHEDEIATSVRGQRLPRPLLGPL
ncbi:aminopeptidase N [Tessaracoccus sp. MC1865]|uniref:aminopeptidase N n=1 Tax=Tessaracoccus sp. MC1865 TaxID=2760310 RepID=UPI001603D992|nr:aminopeptidase N [Tessaracoccus sp. MC1865]MBB1483916.1 aminopeptidase N [Tessaracoccus sp. MC1865]QTO36967.1 aminopeptidase N [Tessaracoccus sp. MC1865]